MGAEGAGGGRGDAGRRSVARTVAQQNSSQAGAAWGQGSRAHLELLDQKLGAGCREGRAGAPSLLCPRPAAPRAGQH